MTEIDSLSGSPRESYTHGMTLPERSMNVSEDQFDESQLRLFVGCVPYDVREEHLLPIFEKYGTVDDLVIARDDGGNSLCYCFLKYSKREEYEKALGQLHGLFYMGQMVIPLQLRYLEPDSMMGEYKVFVGGLPSDMSAEEVRFHLAMQYGPVFDVFMLKRASNIVYGAAFVKFLFRSSAEALIDDAAVHSVFLPNGEFSDTLRASMALSQQPMPHLQQPQTYLPPPPYKEEHLTLTQKQRIFRPVIQNNVVFGSAFRGDVNTPITVDESSSDGKRGEYVKEEGSFNPVKLFVGCLPYSKTAPEVATVFQVYGPLVEVAVLTDTEGRSRGAAFVTFVNKEEALAALSNLSGYVFPNSTRPINVSLAHKQQTHFVENRNIQYPPPTYFPFEAHMQAHDAVGDEDDDVLIRDE